MSKLNINPMIKLFFIYLNDRGKVSTTNIFTKIFTDGMLL